jgi:hypothetical protein
LAYYLGNILAYYLDKTTLLYKYQNRTKRQAKSILLTHKYMTGHFPGVATGTSIKSGGKTMDLTFPS